MEKELWRTDTRSSSYERFIHFWPSKCPCPNLPTTTPGFTLRGSEPYVGLSVTLFAWLIFYVVLDPLFSGARIRADGHTEPEI